MIISGIQALGILLGIAILYEARVLLKRDQFKRRDWGLWTAIGIATLAVSTFPTLSSYFTRLTSLQRGLDAFIVIALFGIYGLVFQVYIRIQETNRQLTNLNREIALKLKEQGPRAQISRTQAPRAQTPRAQQQKA